eukprot:CAMPEP_0206325694 /NCGR_PEP_ID=MMETSP0106_2-20121207/21212_1 /ASSEMBLY_ACC=CAM_ASM_000206 /TAXON_ID=81532 /ORGANISM="Acanthoeca-like sp., Strain 10tr" /LENGTH=144 /DNA_ID=CAMNT_0053758183 /DNA_START=1014 /DNA_END=1448 /DNA_ORIENTATION=+
MARHHNGSFLILDYVFNNVPKLPPSRRVDACCGLIEKDDVGVPDQCDCHAELSLVATGVRPSKAVTVLLKVKPENGALNFICNSVGGHSTQHRKHCQVVTACQVWDEPVVLRRVAHSLARLDQVRGHVVPLDRRRTAADAKFSC